VDPGLYLICVMKIGKVNIGCTRSIVVRACKMTGVTTNHIITTTRETQQRMTYPATAKPLLSCSIMLLVSITPAIPPPPASHVSTMCQIVERTRPADSHKSSCVRVDIWQPDLEVQCLVAAILDLSSHLAKCKYVRNIGEAQISYRNED
jgi:hypothetical protein